MPAPGKIGGKKLTEELIRLGKEAITILDDGTPVTRDEALADLVWKYALGWVEKRRNPATGTLEEIAHPPVAWAAQFLFERREGRAPAALPEEAGGIKATDKVRELAKQRLNSLVKSGPPRHQPKA